ncbi:hypothetical protein OESDEN_06260 [Oesophagostomum dentatum]|uniref:Uncharacterized protein n=1 Tax=Oesophagostomum dentatum TaxID=61180 RepID=A0A0B1T8D1_OESDE|nr:hypothetical protein OESDEN_06260 [Oesophagostomum dentatum]
MTKFYDFHHPIFLKTLFQAQSQVAYTGELDKRKKMEEVRPNFVPAEASGKEKTKEKTPPVQEGGPTPKPASTKKSKK